MRDQCTYILRSLTEANQKYVGITGDLSARLEKHNGGCVNHTRKFKPWKIQAAFWLEDREKAFKFEKYLKSGSGTAFRKRHF